MWTQLWGFWAVFDCLTESVLREVCPYSFSKVPGILFQKVLINKSGRNTPLKIGFLANGPAGKILNLLKISLKCELFFKLDSDFHKLLCMLFQKG